MEEQHTDENPKTQNSWSVPRFKPKRTTWFKSFFGILITVFLLLSIGIIALNYINKPQELRQKAAGNGVTIKLLPAAKSVKVGDTFPLEIWITSASTQQVIGAQISITYDSSAMDITNFTGSTALPQTLAPPVFANGVATVALNAPAASLPSGTFLVGTLTVKAKAGTTPALPNIKFTDTHGANIITVLNYGGNSLDTSSMGGSTITIAPIVTNTPIVTLTSTPTKTPTMTPTKTPTMTPTKTPTPTSLITMTPTKTPTMTPTKTPTPTGLLTMTPTKTPTMTPTKTPTMTPTKTPTITPTKTPTPTSLLTMTPTKTPTPTNKPSSTPTRTPTPTTRSTTNTPTATTTSTQRIPGDISGEHGIPDGVVDLYDYNAIVQDYNQTGAPGWISADVSGEHGVPDGIVDLYDLNVVLENYGSTQ